MASEIVMPRMGLTMETGVLIRWFKAEGELVRAGEPLFEIETDKTTAEVEAPANGRLGKIQLHPGETAPVGGVIGFILQEGESQTAVGVAPQPLQEPPSSAAELSASLVAISQPEKVKASPAARYLAKKLGIDLHQVKASGPGGRVVARNVSATKTVGRGATPLAERMAAELGINLTQVVGSGPGGRVTRQDISRAQQMAANIPAKGTAKGAPTGSETLQPVSHIQQVMAERMVQSFRNAPHFYLHVEVDARGMINLHKALAPKIQARRGVHLTYTDLLVYFCARCLAAHPEMLAQWTDEGIRLPGHVHVGVATDTERGLLVPVIRDAEALKLAELAARRADLVSRARAGALRVEELEGGVFTLTNLGAYGVDSFDAIINPPQAAILAVGRIKERALVENGQVVAASMVTLSLSVDHRVIDGARAAHFLGELVEMLEVPALGIDWG